MGLEMLDLPQTVSEDACYVKLHVHVYFTFPCVVDYYVQCISCLCHMLRFYTYALGLERSE